MLDEKNAPGLEFDPNGVCQYCRRYKRNFIDNAPSEAELQQALKAQLKELKSTKGKYDSIMGLSGGVDSSYLAYKAKEWGLNPLLVHFDNGWNSELAVQNIERIVEYTSFDLYTYVVDWEEFRDIQRAYIKAGVLDWEVPTDHGLFAALYNKAYQLNIKYVLTGANHQTEAILPKSMRWSKKDVANIIDIHKKHGSRKMKTMPILNFYRYSYLQLVKQFKTVNLLEVVEYDKDKAKEVIISEMGWRDYGGKHYESIFTRFYQGYVLLEKFDVDKRRAHLSNLICSGQMTREEAFEELSKSPYDPEMLKQDTEFFLKKMGFTAEEFKQIMNEPPKSHLDYASYETGLYPKHEKLMQRLQPFSKVLRMLRN